MVGDNLAANVEGGQAAGLRTIWVDGGTWPGHEHQPDHVITDVIEGVTVLRDMR